MSLLTSVSVWDTLGIIDKPYVRGTCVRGIVVVE